MVCPETPVPMVLVCFGTMDLSPRPCEGHLRKMALVLGLDEKNNFFTIYKMAATL